MEIKVGEYVRTPLGISKYLGECDDMPNFYKFDKLDEELWFSDIADVIYQNQLDEVILKHSPNIIDLIEIGDYVNGCLIVEINKDLFIKGQINLWTNMIMSEGEPFPNEYYKAKIIEKDIKTIVTHEQFKGVEYEIE